jgi:hypothetical protein
MFIGISILRSHPCRLALEPENANTPDVAGELFLQRDSENYHGGTIYNLILLTVADI